MTNDYCHKHKERLQKEACERYQNLFEEEKQKKKRERYRKLAEEKKEKKCNKNLSEE